MNDPKREILNQVASGRITAEEGAARIEALEAAATPSGGGAATASPQPSTAIREVRLLARLGNTEVIGDPSVATAVAEGPHRARQEGDVLVIDQSPMLDDTTFQFGIPAGLRRLRGLYLSDALTVRMNPALALSTKVQAGNLRVSGVQGSIGAEVQAGNCEITGFRGPLKVNVAAGSLNAKGSIAGGDSKILCRMGEVNVVLDPSSSVRIRARSTLGDVVIVGQGTTSGNEHVVGSGAGTLDCECTMGTVRVAVE